jgi:redox-sensitive bicupin YhaK (pirin superfamily)
MEILSYVLDGALEHRDSMGTGSVLRPGDVQRMTAGTGVTHSERNHSPDEPLHFLQIWVLPTRNGLAPGYEERHFSEEERRGRLRLLASPTGDDASLTWNQDVFAYASLLETGDAVEHRLRPGRHAWLHVARGRAAAGELELETGDGLAVSEEAAVAITALEPSELLLFDLA